MTLNAISYYYRLINELDKRDIDIRPLSELEPTSKPTIGLRHDIDKHPDTALHMARYLAMKGLPGSFFLLHSAPYYTKNKIQNIVHSMIVSGCEIGLHNDAWHYEEKGPQIIQEEIVYLRSLGANIKGTTAHNSLSTYGAANYEVFKERVLLSRKSRLPLGKLSMKGLELTYEGTFSKPKANTTIHEIENHLRKTSSIQSQDWMREFLVNNPYCDYETYAQFWLIGKDEWAISFNGKLYWKASLEEALALVDNLPEKSISLFVIHPTYFDLTPTSEADQQIPHIKQNRWHSHLPPPIKKIGRKMLQLHRGLVYALLACIPHNTRWQTRARDRRTRKTRQIRPRVGPKSLMLRQLDQIPYVKDLVKRLKRNPYLRDACAACARIVRTTAGAPASSPSPPHRRWAVPPGGPSCRRGLG